MMKKALALAGAGAMLLAVAGPALGCWWCGSNDLNINNGASVINNVTTQASTGYNGVGGFGGRIRTGGAGATSVVDSLVNFTMVGYMPMGGY